MLACSVVFNSVTPWIVAHQALCPWDFPGENTWMDSHFLLQMIFLMQGSNPCLLHISLKLQAHSLPPLWFRMCLQCVRPGFSPWVGKISWRREILLTPVFWPGEFHGLSKSWTRLSNFHFTSLLYHHQRSHIYIYIYIYIYVYMYMFKCMY